MSFFNDPRGKAMRVSNLASQLFVQNWKPNDGNKSLTTECFLAAEAFEDACDLYESRFDVPEKTDKAEKETKSEPKPKKTKAKAAEPEKPIPETKIVVPDSDSGVFKTKLPPYELPPYVECKKCGFFNPEGRPCFQCPTADEDPNYEDRVFE
jgi:hypothetical protein